MISFFRTIFPIQHLCYTIYRYLKVLTGSFQVNKSKVSVLSASTLYTEVQVRCMFTGLNKYCDWSSSKQKLSKRFN